MDAHELPFRFKTMEQLLAETVFAVEASGFEKGILWERSHSKMKWGDSQGWLLTLGMVAGSPVCISVFFHQLDGHTVLFFHDTSQVVDHKLISDWLKKHVAAMQKDPHNHCDAQNFHHCVNALQRLNAPAMAA